MWTITGFADEIDHDPITQAQVLTRLGISHIELRSAWGTKVLDLSDKQLKQLAQILDDNGISLSSVGSDLGKIALDDDFDAHIDRTKHAMEVADFFGVDFIRTFSFFMPDGDDPFTHRNQVMDQLGAMVDCATDAGKTLLHENEKDIYGDIPRRVVELALEFDPAHFQLIFDPANYVQCGVKPFDDAFPATRNSTGYIHIKDALFADNSVVPAGEGDGQIPRIVEALSTDGYDGFFSIEPHLGQFDAFGGLCGPELWEKAFRAFEKILDEQGIAWC